MKRREKRIAVFFLSLIIFIGAAANILFAGERDDAYDILDAWTCVRWGEDNIAWVVHYPEELVEPWVKSEAERQKMKPEQADELRKSFSDELRIGSATAVLLSVYGYGAVPVNLSPMAKNIVLLDSSGKRIAPMVFEKKLDNPISGLIQGFVFFPLQSDKDFKVLLKGLVPDKETNFSFNSAVLPRDAIATVSAAPVVSEREKNIKSEEVVVKIPTRRNTDTNQKPQKPETPQPESPEFEAEGEVFPPTQPQEPLVPKPEPEPVFSMEPEKSADQERPNLPPKYALDSYLKAWMDGDTDKMYSLLSSDSQAHISKELFVREVMSGNFRAGLRAGYKVNWNGNSAKVTVAKRVLFVRTLETKQFDLIAENGVWRVTW